ncbi:YeeE/YedE family protein [Rhodospirillaceae bacterium KN72]|uniref:YeeE/YedE family protein n=1 Tax=Pacificispira spongiicola TaxID=2729598 RepID=A0A7Y0DZF8_9PROT|nr:YeeE/YedE family protein [Pacificispira spongiicola]NMM44425.1 YeeE/YedE family protein [Pacificispira spongiicola]
MKSVLTSLISGLLFGAGLAISGMMNPAKVVGFLDMLGNWDPSLAFVMGGALAVSFISYRLAAARSAPLFATAFQTPTQKQIDPRLIAGAVLFGLGWGIAGLCPGPAVAALVTGTTDILIFVGAMLGGMLVYRVVLER